VADYGTRRRDDKQLQPRYCVFPALALDGSGGVSIAHVAVTHDDPTAHSVWPCCVNSSVLDNAFDSAFDSDFVATLSKVTQSDGPGQQFITERFVMEAELLRRP
jgi:hypothetical protein